MHKQKLIMVMSAMTKKELARCKKHLTATMRTNSYEYKLFDYVYKCKHDWKARKLGIEYAINRVRPGSSIKKFESLMSDLTSRIEQYLILYDLDTPQRRFENQLRLAEFYKRKGMDKFFLQTTKKLESLLKDIPPFDTNYSLYKLQLNHLIYFSSLEDAPKDLLEDNLIISEDFFEKQQQIYTLERQNLKNVFQRDVPLKEKENSDELSKLFKKEYELIYQQKETAFFFLKDQLINYTEKFSDEHAYRLLNYLKNYCIAESKKGNKGIIKKYSELNDFGITSGISLFNGKLSERMFLNYIDVKSKYDKLSKAEMDEVIEDCHLYVNSVDIDRLKTIAYAIYFFANRDYNKVWDCIRHSTFSKQNGTLYSKAHIFLLICQYKSPVEHHDFQSVINNTRKRFSKKIPNIPDKSRQANLHLISFIEKLWKKESPSMLRTFVENHKPLTQLQWIMEEIELLAQNSK